MCLAKQTVIAAIVLLVITSWSILSHAIDNQKTIVILETMAVPAVQENTKSFKKHMEESEFAKKYGLEIVLLSAEGNLEHGVKVLREELKRSPADCVVTMATLASQAAKEVLQGTTVPLVFGVVADPVGSGLIDVIGKPTGTNITGLVHTMHRDTKIAFMRKIWAGTKLLPLKVGVVQSDYPSTVGDLEKIRTLTAATGDFVFLSKIIPYRDMPENLDIMLKDVVKGIAQLDDTIDFWWQLAGPLAETAEYTEIFNQHSHRPIGYGNTMDSVRRGALFTINADFEAGGKEIAERVIAILEGQDPGTIPVSTPDTFRVGINLTTALKFGLLIPSDILDLAGDNVFR